jgi:HAD superfamily hydrolase (TIGR01490 family)
VIQNRKHSTSVYQQAGSSFSGGGSSCDSAPSIARSRLSRLLSKDMEISDPQTLPLTRKQFVDMVLSLAARVAAFDCDGTLWSRDAGEGFLDWEIRTELVSAEVGCAMRARYAEYKLGRVSEDEMSSEMVTMHEGMSENTMMQAAEEFMSRAFQGKVFEEVLDLIQQLRGQGCDIWVVSSSNEWVIRAGIKQFGVAENRILATKAEVQNGIVTDRLVRLPSGPGKPRALREFLDGKALDAAFGNSRWDTEMLAIAGHSFAINPTPELEITARERGWMIYFPDATGRR